MARSAPTSSARSPTRPSPRRSGPSATSASPTTSRARPSDREPAAAVARRPAGPPLRRRRRAGRRARPDARPAFPADLADRARRLDRARPPSGARRVQALPAAVRLYGQALDLLGDASGDARRRDRSRPARLASTWPGRRRRRGLGARRPASDIEAALAPRRARPATPRLRPGRCSRSGEIEQKEGDLDAALATLSAAAERFRELDDQPGRARRCASGGWPSSSAAASPRPSRRSTAALAAFEEVGDRRAEAWALAEPGLDRLRRGPHRRGRPAPPGRPSSIFSELGRHAAAWRGPRAAGLRAVPAGPLGRGRRRSASRSCEARGARRSVGHGDDAAARGVDPPVGGPHRRSRRPSPSEALRAFEASATATARAGAAAARPGAGDGRPRRGGLRPARRRGSPVDADGRRRAAATGSPGRFGRLAVGAADR